MLGGDVLELHVDVCIMIGGAVAFKGGGFACWKCSHRFVFVTEGLNERSPSVVTPGVGAALPTAFLGACSSLVFLVAPRSVSLAALSPISLVGSSDLVAGSWLVSSPDGAFCVCIALHSSAFRWSDYLLHVS